MKIRSLYISPGHNFVGHHGKPAGTHQMLEQMRIECIAGKGICGDRFFDYKPDFKGQITFFAWEVYESLALFVGNPSLPSYAMRRNVITEGIDLNEKIGQEFEIQGVRFLGTEECKPCYWMEEAVGKGAEEFLKGRGGLRAKILTDGLLQVE